jgi:hypothetical protein
MPIRFSTQAANADILGEDAENTMTPDARPADRFDRGSPRYSRGEARNGDAKSGKDINAAGFVKDKDAGKP